MSAPLCIVIPVLNEGAQLPHCLRALQPYRTRGARIVVVDGGSSDASRAIAERFADIVFVGPRGRAAQMNAGVAACPAEVYLFLHADSRLPASADADIRRALIGGYQWGRFDVRIQGRHPLLPLVARLMNVRSRLTGIATGDHALFVRHELFMSVMGFPELPLMEDIGLCKVLLRRGRPACLRAVVQTSGRRWDQDGFLRTLGLMWGLRLAYSLGVSPARLAPLYGDTREQA
jgi:rSAM/selenodomain-associated transferase 2